MPELPNTDSSAPPEPVTPPPAGAAAGAADVPPPAETADESAKHIARLDAENKSYRTESKRLKDEHESFVAKVAKTLGLAGTDKVDEAVTASKAATDARHRHLLLRSEFVAVAVKQGVVDPLFVFDALSKDLKGIPVDLENETVDREALAEKVTTYKQSHGFLFAPPPGAPPARAPVANPDGTGRPAGGGSNPYDQYLKMQSEGRNAEAQRFYAANHKDMLAELKRRGK